MQELGSRAGRMTVKITPPLAGEVAPSVLPSGFAVATESQRVFHRHTFVIDLESSKEQLWKGMRATNRNLCNRAAQTGIEVSIKEEPTPWDLGRFHAAYSRMARNRRLTIPRYADLDAMRLDHRLVLGVATRRGADLSMALIYRAGDQAMYIYGVSPCPDKLGGGQVLQWETIGHLKALGISQYDLGGVPSVDDSNGIFKFKQGFGGRLVEYGPEYCHESAWLRAMNRLRRRVW